MKKLIFCLTLVAGILPPQSGHADQAEVEALVEAVRREALKESAFEDARLQEFLDARDNQAAMLEQARQDLADANSLADNLRVQYEQNETTLTEYQAALVERSGDLEDVFAIVRQAALSADAVMNTSLVSAQTQRTDFLSGIGQGQRTPTIDDINRLWTEVLTEISESGKVVRFDATVIRPQGDETIQEVLRAGVFTAASNGSFLRYLPDSGKFVELSRQPPLRFRAMAEELQATQTGVAPMALDPSKGAILSLMVQSPDISERVQQGGGIGYVILALGALGLATVIRRAIGLYLSKRAIERQATAAEPDLRNALGRIRKVALESSGKAPESVEIMLDEQLAEEASRLNRGLPLVAMLAAVSPLLGLLGTVTGMIETFQSITLFGTGDPKLMSGGISQALVTTELGLVVAIPLVLFHSLLTGRVNRQIEQLGKYISEINTRHELA